MPTVEDLAGAMRRASRVSPLATCFFSVFVALLAERWFWAGAFAQAEEGLWMVKDEDIYTPMILQDIERTVSLKNRVVVMNYTVVLEKRTLTANPVTSWYFALPKSYEAHLGHIEASWAEWAHANAPIHPEIKSVVPQRITTAREALAYRIDFDTLDKVMLYRVPFDFRGFKDYEDFQFTVTAYLGRMYHPFPEQQSFAKPHHVVFEDVPAMVSVYPIMQQKTTYIFPKDTLYDFSGPVKNEGSTGRFTWQHKGKVEAFQWATQEKAWFHYSFRRHLVYLSEVEREVYVSQWNDVWFHERYEAANEAAKMDAPFDRSEIERLTHIGLCNRRPPSYQSPHHSYCFDLTQVISPWAYNLQYYDEIGNISTSSAEIVDNRFIKWETVPRYPLAGGWKADWYTDYVLPFAAVLSVSQADATRRLNFPINSGYWNVFTEKMRTKIVLPAGSRDIKVYADRHVESAYLTKTRYWLDFFSARPVIVVEVFGIAYPIEQMAWHQIQVTFKPKSSMADLTALMIMILSFLAAILVGLVLRRLRFSLTPPSLVQKSLDANPSAYLETIDSYLLAAKALLERVSEKNAELMKQLTIPLHKRARFEDAKTEWQADCAKSLHLLSELANRAHTISLGDPLIGEFFLGSVEDARKAITATSNLADFLSQPQQLLRDGWVTGKPIPAKQSLWRRIVFGRAVQEQSLRDDFSETCRVLSLRIEYARACVSRLGSAESEDAQETSDSTRVMPSVTAPPPTARTSVPQKRRG